MQWSEHIKNRSPLKIYLLQVLEYLNIQSQMQVTNFQIKIMFSIHEENNDRAVIKHALPAKCKKYKTKL